MAGVVGLDAVYAKWENRAANGGYNSRKPGPHFKSSQNAAEQAVSSGRSAWKSKYKTLPPPPERRTRQTRPKTNSFQLAPVTALLGEFKKSPSIQPQYGLYMRPITTRCCICMPISRDTFVQPDNMGIPDKCNVLRLPQLACKDSWIASLFSNISYTYRHTVRFGYPNITESVLRSHTCQIAVERTVQELLELNELPLDENSKEYKQQKKKCENQLKKMFNNMKAVMSIPIFKLTGWVLNLVLGSLLNSIQVNNNQLQSLKDASLSGKPVIYLPTHRSHLDYVLITYILWHYGIRAPYVAAGDNLNIFGFGPILRSLGGFFIRRRLDKEAGKKDHLYRAVLREYVQELLERGQSLEFFVEGGRSRSGKSLYPKAGLLSIVVDWLLASKNDTDGLLTVDALIVPVSISYEKIMDGNFTREQMGQPKSKESFWATVKAIWKLFSSSFGNVRVDFCQPFSLKEYLSVNKASYLPAVRGDSPVLGLPHLKDSMADLQQAGMEDADTTLPRAVSDNSIYGIEVCRDEEKVVVDALARHVVYNSIQSYAVMSTHLVAFNFLINHRKGASFSEVMSTLDALRDKVLSNNRDLGFVGKSCDIITHACRLFGSKLIKIIDLCTGELLTWAELSMFQDRADELILYPNIELPSILELWYYGSAVFSVFALPSLIASAICSVVGEPLLDEALSDSYSQKTFTKDSVVAHASFLAEILRYESLFCSPCNSLEDQLADVFETMVGEELIVSPDQEDEFNEEAQQWASRIKRTTMHSLYGDDVDEYNEGYDREYQLSAERKHLMKFYCSIVEPYIESYWVTLCQLENLLEEDKSVDSFMKKIHSHHLQRVNGGISLYAETASEDLVRNALRSFADMKIVENYIAASVKMLTLGDNYTSKSQLDDVIARLDRYRPC